MFWGTHIVTKRLVVDLLHLCCGIVVRCEVRTSFRFGLIFGAAGSLRAPFECDKFLSSPSRLRFCLVVNFSTCVASEVWLCVPVRDSVTSVTRKLVFRFETSRPVRSERA